MPDTPPTGQPGVTFTERVLIAAAVGTGLFLAWQVADVFILVFGGVLLATLLRALCDPVVAAKSLPERWALLLVVAGLMVVSGTILFVIGERLAEQLSQLSTQVPDAWARAKLMLQQSQVGRSLLDGLASSGSALSSRIGSFASGTLGALANTGLVLFLGLFMAADPELYRCGLLRLVPLQARARCDMALVEAGHALKRWLLGQLIAMICVGALTGLGLWALGVPLALSLGILAGALDFVPYIGPIAAALPAVLLGFTQNPKTALYVALLYAAVQQIEGNVIVPLAQRWAVSLPPALAIVSVIVFGLIFGLPGLLFATPLMVVIIILVRKLYVEGVLEQNSEMSSGPRGTASG